MKNKKNLYIAILLISALFAYLYNQAPDKDTKVKAGGAGRTDGSSSSSASAPAPAPRPDYRFTLRAAGRGAGMPVYSRYAVAVYGDKARAEKEFECVLGFTPGEILHLEKFGKTLLIKDDGTEFYIFDEKERKVKDKVISFPARESGSRVEDGTKDSVTAAAVSADEKLIALALGGKKSIEFLSAENFQIVLSAPAGPDVQEAVTGLRFDDKNNLYITGSDGRKKTAALYLCRANLSYSKIEKISGFTLEADSQSESRGAGLFTYYNRRSGSVFKIDASSAQSGLIFNDAPQQAGEITAAEESGAAANGRAKQLVALNDYTALVRSDLKKIKVFSTASGAVTKEIELAGLSGAEITDAKAGLEYAFIASTGGGRFWLLNSADLRLAEGGALEGMTSLAAVSIGR